MPGNGTRPPRETPIAPWTGQLLKHWLAVRAGTRLPQVPHADGRGGTHGPFLFPTRSGKLWSTMAHYQAVAAVMEAAEIDEPGEGGGAFRLRHTFALRQLRKHKTVSDVARWMGIANLTEMDRYLDVLANYEEVF